MKIEKDGKIYTVKETDKKWLLSTTIGAVEVKYEVLKTDCPEWSELVLFVLQSAEF